MSPNSDLVVIGEGGGMRNGYLTGVLMGLRLSPAHVSAGFACSTGAAALAFWATGQNDLIARLWVDTFTRSEVFTFGRMILERKLSFNVDHLVDVGFRGLNDAVLAREPTRLFVSVVDVESGETRLVKATPENLRPLLKATMSLAPYAKPHLYEGRWSVDGGYEWSLPVLKAYQAGSRRFLVVSNQPQYYQEPKYGWLKAKLLFPGLPGVQAAVQRRAAAYRETWKFIHHPPPDADVFVIRPQRALPATRTERSEARMLQTVFQGQFDGLRHREAVHHWLGIPLARRLP